MVDRGEILANLRVRQACKRHLTDLKRSESPDYPYRFDLRKAGKICYWLELMPNVDAPGCPNIVLLLWQKFVLGSIYGWVRKRDGMRRFTHAYIKVPRKSGKTTLLAAVGWFGLCMDGEQGAQVYNGANKLEQAMFLFDPAKAMRDARIELFDRLKVEKRGEKALWLKGSNARWRPVSKKPGDGGGASLFIQDEFHEAANSKLTEAIEEGQDHRPQPLSIKITTAGDNIGGPCYSYELQMEKVLDGTIPRETTFAIMYGIDLQKYTDPFGVEREPDDWATVEALKKANPSWGVSVLEDNILPKLERAIQEPGYAFVYKTKRLNMWCNAANGYFNLQKWGQCLETEHAIEFFAGMPCVLGLDLASKLDLCAVCRVFRIADPADPDNEERAHYYVMWRKYLPSAIVQLKQNTHFRDWVAAGHLTSTEGEVTDYGFIFRDLVEDCDNYDVREACYDQRESGLLMQQFTDKTAVPLFEVPQTTAVLSEPMKWLESLIIGKRIHHFGDPVATWCISNTVSKEDANRNHFPRRAKPELKIDCTSALLDALVRAREVLNQPPPVPFEVEVWS